MSGSVRALAIVDWGIGGLDVWAQLCRLAPGAAVTYVSDSGAPPYGTLSRQGLYDRLARLIDGLAARGADHVFLACNAASTALAQVVRFAVPTAGIIDAGVQTVVATKLRRVGLVGGIRTVRSGIYRRRLADFGIEVRARVAQPLSAAVEAGQADTPATRELVRRIVAPLGQLDAVLLACTHYPAARLAFETALPATQLLDPAPEAARTLAAMLRCSPGQDPRRVGPVFTTGNPEAMREAARRAFAVELRHVQRFTLT